MGKKKTHQAKETSLPAMLSFKFLNPIPFPWMLNYYCLQSHASIPLLSPTESVMQLFSLPFHLLSASSIINRPCKTYGSCSKGREPGAASEILAFLCSLGKNYNQIIIKALLWFPYDLCSWFLSSPKCP